jgi:hypothetical protein
MLNREFVKRIRLLLGRTETVKTRFELKEGGVLIEHVSLETNDPPPPESGRTSPGAAGVRTAPARRRDAD